MNAPQAKKNNSTLFKIFLAGALVLALYFILEPEEMTPPRTTATKKRTQQELRSVEYEKTVNKNLLLTSEAIELQRRKMELDQLRLLQAADKGARPSVINQEASHLDPSPENPAEEMALELGRARKPEEITNPDELVQKELFNKIQMAEYTQAYKEEYARQFVENARRGGYKIILSSDLSRVISVTPIRQPSQNQMELFRGNPVFSQ